MHKHIIVSHMQTINSLPYKSLENWTAMFLQFSFFFGIVHNSLMQ